MPAPRLILASASPWRAKLLTDVGVHVELFPAPIDEEAIIADDPVALAVARAAAKAEAVAARISSVLQPPASSLAAVILGADQVAHLDGEAFGKPRDPDDHRRRLRLLRGRTHTLSTAVAFRGPAGVLLGLSASPADFVEHTHIRFRCDVTDDEIDAYVKSGDGSGCAGGYRAEGPGAWLIAGVDGDWTNVIGLPVFGVLHRLRRLGFPWGASSPGTS